MTHIGGDSLNIPADWTFMNSNVAGNFDKHVRQQLPWYDFATAITVNVAKAFMPIGGRCYDIGAGTGNIGWAIAETIANRSIDLIGVEPSTAMIKPLIDATDSPYKQIITQPIENVLFDPYDVAICFLTLMFVPVAARKTAIDSMFRHIRKGGALIVVEKMINHNPYLNTVFNRLTWAMKLESTNQSEIVAKELSINGIQRPIDESELPGEPVCFFRCGDFAGWVCQK